MAAAAAAAATHRACARGGTRSRWSMLAAALPATASVRKRRPRYPRAAAAARRQSSPFSFFFEKKNLKKIACAIGTTKASAVGESLAVAGCRSCAGKLLHCVVLGLPDALWRRRRLGFSGWRSRCAAHACRANRLAGEGRGGAPGGGPRPLAAAATGPAAAASTAAASAAGCRWLLSVCLAPGAASAAAPPAAPLAPPRCPPTLPPGQNGDGHPQPGAVLDGRPAGGLLLHHQCRRVGVAGRAGRDACPWRRAPPPPPLVPPPPSLSHPPPRPLTLPCAGYTALWVGFAFMLFSAVTFLFL